TAPFRDRRTIHFSWRSAPIKRSTAPVDSRAFGGGNPGWQKTPQGVKYRIIRVRQVAGFNPGGWLHSNLLALN
ncbi:MAG: hypothetical protein AAB403_08730, partial [Planctomycetota bacterium]